MADNIEQTEQQVAHEADKAELDRQMQMAFTGMIPDEPAAGDTGIAVAGAAPAGAIAAAPFSFDTFKEKFGWQKPEDAMTEIESLRALKAAPPKVEYEFENAESKNLFEAFRKGDKKSVLAFVSQQEKLNDILAAEVNKDTAPEIIKLGLQVKHKDLTPAEIEYKYKKMYSIPPKPAQASDEDPEAYKDRVAAWQEVVNDKNMELVIDAKLLRPDLESSKAKLVFPEIEQQSDQAYLDYKKAVEDGDKGFAEAIKEYKTYTPKTVETKLQVVDTKNNITIDFQYEPDPASFAKSLEEITDIEKFYASFKKPDGSPDRVGFFRTLNNARNMDKVLTAALVQAKDATLKSFLPDNSQPSGLVRQINGEVVVETEMDKNMALAGVRKRQ